MTPPPLVWIHKFVASIERAVDYNVLLDLRPTVNPLQYYVSFHWPVDFDPITINMIWNMFQMWASKNDCVPNGLTVRNRDKLSVGLVIKRRLGSEKNDTP
jgi:hypothetical protein